MKKLFKILRKIIKILLKSILWLILGIIVIITIGLVIINNKTLKFYENEDGNIRFTMNKDFKVEDGYEVKISLNEGSFLFKAYYFDVETVTNIFDISLKNLNFKFKTFEKDIFKERFYNEGFIEYEEGFIKLNIPNKSFINNLREKGDIKNFIGILPYCFDGYYTSYYENGQIKNKRQISNGLENGYFVRYYENGQIENEGIYENGQIIGKTVSYYENGKIKKEGIFKNGDGVQTGYYNNGQIDYIKNYKDGELDGVQTGYYDNGQIDYIKNYKDGKIDGIQTGYYDNGQIDYIKNYKDGELDGKSFIYYDDGSYSDIEINEGIGIHIKYDKDNNIILKYGFITNKLNEIIYNGNYIQYFKNGKVTEGNYINGKKNGSRTGYYENNSIRFIGNFENGSGIISFFDEDGNLIGTGKENYDIKGNIIVKNGLYISLYNNGQIYEISNYKDGILNGIQTGYYENGQISFVCNYVNGFKNGKCSTYYENGQIKEESEFYGDIHTYLFTYELGNRKYYDELGNFVGSGEIKCLNYDLNYNKLCSNLSFNGFFFTYYPSLKTKSIEYLEDYIEHDITTDKNNGYYMNYYENGQIQKVENYNDGTSVSYYENGQIQFEFDDDGNTEYNKNGQIIKKWDYNNGKKVGYRVEYFEDGNIYSEGNYVDGKRVGIRNWYLGDGSIGFSKNYDE